MRHIQMFKTCLFIDFSSQALHVPCHLCYFVVFSRISFLSSVTVMHKVIHAVFSIRVTVKSCICSTLNFHQISHRAIPYLTFKCFLVFDSLSLHMAFLDRSFEYFDQKSIENIQIIDNIYGSSNIYMA